MDVGLKVSVTPPGAPLADKEIAELNPPATLVEIVVEPLFPCKIETDPGDAAIENEGVLLAVVRALISPALGEPQPVTRSYPVTAE